MADLKCSVQWASGREVPPAKLNPPTGLLAVANGLSAITTSWTPPADKGSATGYRVYHSDNNRVFAGYAQWGLNTLVVTTDDQGDPLQPGTEYRFVAVTTNGSSEESIDSNLAIATTEPAEVPADGNMVRDPRTPTGLIITDPLTVSNVIIGQGLLVIDPRSNTGLRVSDPTGRITPVTPVSRPTITQFYALNDAALSLHWHDNQTNPSDSFLINVEESASGNPVSGWDPKQVAGSLSSTTIPLLQPDTVYKATVTAVANNEQSQPSPAAEAKTAEPQQPGDFVPWKYLPMQGVDGQNLTGVDYMNRAGNTVYDDSQALPGTLTSAQAYIDKGCDGGPGGWGGGLAGMPAGIGTGAEIWVSIWMRVPSDFAVPAQSVTSPPSNPDCNHYVGTACSQLMKWLRFHKKDMANPGNNQGWIDFLVSNSGYVTSSELADTWQVQMGYRSENPFNDGKWHRWEWYNLLSHTQTGRSLFWCDGILIGERKNYRNLVNATNEIDEFLLLNYFNCNSPETQTLNFQNVVVATSLSPPEQQDADGNYMIGDYRGSVSLR